MSNSPQQSHKSGSRGGAETDAHVPAGNAPAEGQSLTAPCCCEYYCSGNQWWCIDAHPPSGYYCQGHIGATCQSGYYTYFPPVPNGNRVASSSVEDPSLSDSDEHCTYANVGGEFRLISGNCASGNYCPTDLLAYLQAHDAELFAFLVANPTSLQSLSIRPGSILGSQAIAAASPSN